MCSIYLLVALEVVSYMKLEATVPSDAQLNVFVQRSSMLSLLEASEKKIPPLISQSLCTKFPFVSLPPNAVFVVLIKSHSLVCPDFPLSA